MIKIMGGHESLVTKFSDLPNGHAFIWKDGIYIKTLTLEVREQFDAIGRYTRGPFDINCINLTDAISSVGYCYIAPNEIVEEVTVTMEVYMRKGE